MAHIIDPVLDEDWLTAIDLHLVDVSAKWERERKNKQESSRRVSSNVFNYGYISL